MKSQNNVIVVVDNGFVFWGDMHVDGDNCKISEGYNLRRFGTTRGLGQLAIEGPTAETQADKVFLIHVLKTRVVFVMECSDAMLKLRNK
jgi:hypothetical protein